MRLTAYTDYALRVLIRLAVGPRDLTTMTELADSYGISENHLTKVVHQLGVAGYAKTVRGQNRGIRLLKRPGDISIGELVRRAESDLDLVPCFAESKTCAIEPACVLKDALADARAVFLAALKRYTLAEAHEALAKLRDFARRGPITLPVAAHGELHDSAVVVHELLRANPRAGGVPARTTGTTRRKT